ncbi:ATP-binding protein, partial [Pseudomonas sp. DCB_AW]|nr:ATP-binding protein [Pseudomonas sp. DCB_AW]
SRWNLQAYPGLVLRHPAVIAAVLHRDFCRGRDDVTVLVLDLDGTENR